jgi:hypothetical protein
MLFYQNLRDYIEGEKARLDDLAKSGMPEQGIVLEVYRAHDKIEDQDRTKDLPNYSRTHPAETLEIDYLGIIGDRHRRATRHSTGREKHLYPAGTPIREQRHVTAISPHDLDIMTKDLGVDVTPELLGINLVIGSASGKEYSLSALPQNTYLVFADERATELPRPPIATLRNYTLQQGCDIAGKTIAHHYGNPALQKHFVNASKFNRGIVLTVQQPINKPAVIKPGQRVFFRYPMGITP